MTKIIYLRMKKNAETTGPGIVKLKHIASVASSDLETHLLEDAAVYRITEQDKNIAVIDGFTIISHLTELCPECEFQLVGPQQTIVRIKKHPKDASVLMAAFVWLLLFIGAGMTIVNFHYDVSMQQVQQQIHYLFTGKQNEFPLWIQIPYSFGLGAGMLLFFNHWFKKRINEEPSPLEVELFNYQQDLDNYVNHHENKLNDKKHFN